MNKKAIIGDLVNRAKNGENIIEFLTDQHMHTTSELDEMISYDIRAGMDVKGYKEQPEIYDAVVSRIIDLVLSLKEVKGGRILECGSGEGIILSNLIRQMGKYFELARGVDISWSRVSYAKRFTAELGVDSDIDYYVADFFKLPFNDNSFDVLYTMDGIYAMGGNEQSVIKELYRVSSKYLMLIEPSYEFGNDAVKERIDRLGYVKNLFQIVEEMGLEVVRYEPFGVDINPMNPAAVLIIKKNQRTSDNYLCCPVTHEEMQVIGNCYYSSKSFLSYPIVNNIPCLTEGNAIITAKLKEFF